MGILGASGYAGAELVRLAHAHPRLDIRWLGAREHAGKPLAEVLPGTVGVAGLGERTLTGFDPEVPDQVAALAGQLDVVFSALPHGKSAAVVAPLFRAGVRVVDLSADFRLRSLSTYERWYGKHPAPDLIADAVYGQPEINREQLSDARLIAAPGCYPTSAALPLYPLISAGMVDVSTPIVIDAKSGVSGAGRKARPNTHLPETAEGMRPYAVAGAHRHTPEIEQTLSLPDAPVSVLFTPQLAPMTRGILTCAYVRLTEATDNAAERARTAARRSYVGGLVSVLDAGRLPDTLWVRGSARAHVAYAFDPRTGWLVSMCAIDNLTRGAAAQAIQALNVALGWSDALGLPELAQFP